MTVGQILTLILGGGAVATITALFNGIKQLREGSRTKDRDTIGSLIQRAKDAELARDRAFDARDRAFDERDYWRNWAGSLEYAINSKGNPLPAKPEMPKPEVNRDDER